MNCPVCKESQLVMSERLGVEIDYCPQCRGVWLDRGELDKIIQYSVERQVTQVNARPQSQPQPPTEPAYYDAGYGGDRHHGSRHGGHGKYGRRPKSFLERLFD